MNISFYSKRILKSLGIAIVIPFLFFEINTISKQTKAEKNLVAASEKDLFLYRQMGASYLCIASKALFLYVRAIGLYWASFSFCLSTKAAISFKISKTRCSEITP